MPQKIALGQLNLRLTGGFVLLKKSERLLQNKYKSPLKTAGNSEFG